MISRSTFGAALKAAREEAGLDLSLVAYRAGLGLAAARALEAGDSRAGLPEYIAALHLGRVESGLLLSAAELAWGGAIPCGKGVEPVERRPVVEPSAGPSGAVSGR